MLIQLSQMAVACPEFMSVDINPSLCDADGVMALDARVRIDPARCDMAAPNPDLVIRPYPDQWETSVELASGHIIDLRPIRPEDEPLYETFVAHLSPDDVRNRFFTSRNEFPHEFIARFTQIDYARSMAFIAVAPESGEMLGVVRMSADKEYTTAEFVIIVRNDRQHAGIGRALMIRLIAYARAEGLKSLTGHVLANNTRTLSFCRSLQFEQRHDCKDRDVVRVVLPLDEADLAQKPEQTAA